MAKSLPHVALIVETSLAPGREMLSGITRFVRENRPWATFVAPRSLEESVPSWIARWRGDGIIARVQNIETAQAVLDSGIPAIDILGAIRADALPLVHTDDRRIAQAGAQHLLERGFQHFAFYGWVGEPWSERRADAFAAEIRHAGYGCTLFETTHGYHHSRPWEDYADELALWVRSLEKPVGLMLCSDQCGPVLLEACRRANCQVPDDVAVIGVDNDEPLCEASSPALSSVWPDHFGVGYEAASLLERLMEGKPPPSRPILLPPKGVVTRPSTDVLAIEDRDVAAAVRFIRERATLGVTIDDVAEQVGVSRSMLQRRFRKSLGHTLHDEIVRVRLNRAKELLGQTDLAISTIAEKAGFTHQEYLGVVFRQRVGQTPAQYRRNAKG